jgi:hypothetical protein
MKIIITESQYNELNKIDDIYDNLDPYFRRRVETANISDKIDEKIDWVLDNYELKYVSSRDRALSIVLKEVVKRLIWLSRVWGPDWDEGKSDEYDDLMGKRIMDRYGDEIKRKILEKIK